MKYKSFFYMLSLLFLSACSNSDDEVIKKGHTLDITLPWFEIELTLSSEAKQALTQSGDEIFIDVALYHSLPTYKPSEQIFPRYSNGLKIGSFILANQSAPLLFRSFEGETLRIKVLKNPKDFKPLKYDIVISPYSGNKGNSQNLLDCELSKTSLEAIRHKRKHLFCTLLK